MRETLAEKIERLKKKKEEMKMKEKELEEGEKQIAEKLKKLKKQKKTMKRRKLESFDELVTALEKDLGEMHGISEDTDLIVEAVKRKSGEMNAMNEELRASEEELKASNEELQASNEELQSAMEELKISRERISQIIEGSSIPAFVIDENHVVTHMNRACSRLTGLSAARMIGTKNQWKAFYPKKRPVMADFVVDNASESTIRRYYKDKYRKSKLITGAYEVEDFFPRSGKWLLFTSAPLRNANGKITGALETLQDITEQKKMEERADENRRRFAAVFDGAQDGILVADIKTKKFMLANPAATGIIGYPEKELLKMDVLAIHPKKDLKYVLNQFDKQAKGKVVVAKDIPVLGKNKKIVYCDVSSAKVKMNGKEYLVGFFRDVTERHKTEKKLRTVNRSLQLLSECNQKLIHAEDELELLQDICRLIVKDGGYRMAWVGFALQNREKSVQPVAQYGFEKNYLDTVRITWANKARGRGPTGTAIRTGKHVIARNIATSPDFRPWRTAAVKRGYCSSIALPLKIDDDVFGALNIYSAKPDAFNKEEIALIMEMANNLAYGISALRARADYRRAMEAELNIRERYRHTLDSMLEGCQIIGFDWKYIYVNDAATKHGRRSKKELLGRTMMETYPDIEKTEMFACVERCMKKRKPHHMENEFIFPDGSRGWFELSIEPVPEGVLVFSRDITERKKAAEALKRSERNYRTLVENIPQKIFMKDKDSVYVSCNEDFAKDLGIKVSEFRGKNDFDFFPKKLAQKYRADDKRIMKAGKTVDIEEKYISKGKEYWVHTIKTPVRDEKGKVIGILGIFWDITQDKEAEKKLKDAYEKTRAAEEELRSSNEELQATNEELESTTEELRKAKAEVDAKVRKRTAALEQALKKLKKSEEKQRDANEELRSVNEELRTTSKELIKKSRQLAAEKKSVEKKVKQRTEQLEKAKTEVEEIVKKRTAELEEAGKQLEGKVKELEEINQLAVGRELKMIELKKEIARLKKIAGES